MNKELIVNIEALKVCYGSFVAVDGLDLQLYRGELFGLLGPNGGAEVASAQTREFDFHQAFLKLTGTEFT